MANHHGSHGQACEGGGDSIGLLGLSLPHRSLAVAAQSLKAKLEGVACGK